MTVYFADTNVFIRFFLKDNIEQYTQVESLIRKAKSGKIKLVIPQIIIFEVLFVLKNYYDFNKQEIVNKLKSLVSASYFDVQDREIFILAIELYKVENLSFVDCFLLAKAQIEGI